MHPLVTPQPRVRTPRCLPKASRTAAGRQPDCDFLISRLLGIGRLGQWGNQCRLERAVGPRGRVDVLSAAHRARRPRARCRVVRVGVGRGDGGGSRRVRWTPAQQGGFLRPRPGLSRAGPSMSGLLRPSRGTCQSCPGHTARLAEDVQGHLLPASSPGGGERGGHPAHTRYVLSRALVL